MAKRSTALRKKNSYGSWIPVFELRDAIVAFSTLAITGATLYLVKRSRPKRNANTIQGEFSYWNWLITPSYGQYAWTLSGPNGTSGTAPSLGEALGQVGAALQSSIDAQ